MTMQVYLPEDPETPQLSSITCCWRVIVSKKWRSSLTGSWGRIGSLDLQLMTIGDHREVSLDKGELVWQVSKVKNPFLVPITDDSNL